MARFIVWRLGQAVPVLFGVTLIAFVLIHLVPGDPIRVLLGYQATPEDIAFWREYYSLNDPVLQQYFTSVSHMLRLDLGDSIQLRQSVNSLLIQRGSHTLMLVGYAIVLSLLVAVPLSVISALRANRFTDVTIKTVLMITFAMPSFWVGLLLVLFFSLRLGWFPSSGLGEGFWPMLRSLTLPAVTISLGIAPILVRTLRIAMIETLRGEPVEAARARGLSERTILLRYVLRNSLIAGVTVVGINVGGLIGGTVIVENVFAIPGIGTLMVGAVTGRDFPVIEGCVLAVGVGVLLANLLADMANALLDPRTRQ